MACSVAVNALAQTQQPVLTFEAALETAQTESSTIQARGTEAEAAWTMATYASRLPDPVLRLAVDNLPIEGANRYGLNDDFMTMRSVEIMQIYTAGSKRKAQANRYEQEADLAKSRRSAETASVLSRTAAAWFDRYYQERILDLLHRLHGESVSLQQAAEAGYRGGRGSQADVITAHVALARLEERLHEANSDLETAQAQLQRWVNNASRRSLGPPPRIDHSHLAESPVEHQIDHHPDIAVMNALERVALADVDIARSERRVDWTWSLMYSKRGNAFGDMVSLGVSVPVQWDRAHRQDKLLAASLERVEHARFERDEMRREHLSQVQGLLARWRGNLARLSEYDARLIPLAKSQTVTAHSAFSGGKTSLAETLEANRMETEVQLDRLRLERETALLWSALEFLIPPDATNESSLSRETHPSLGEDLP